MDEAQAEDVELEDAAEERAERAEEAGIALATVGQALAEVDTLSTEDPLKLYNYCDTCPFHGNTMVDWDTNRRQCAGWFMDPLGRCVFELHDLDVPLFDQTEQSWLNGQIAIMQMLIRQQTVELRKRIACNKGTREITHNFGRLLTIIHGLFKTLSKRQMLTKGKPIERVDGSGLARFVRELTKDEELKKQVIEGFAGSQDGRRITFEKFLDDINAFEQVSGVGGEVELLGPVDDDFIETSESNG